MTFLSLNGNPVHVPSYEETFDAVEAALEPAGADGYGSLCWTGDAEFIPSNGMWRVAAYLWMPDPHHPNRDPYDERTFVLGYGNGGWTAADADRGHTPWCRDVRQYGLADAIAVNGHWMRRMDPEGFDRARSAFREMETAETEAPDPYETYEAERWPHRMRISRR